MNTISTLSSGMPPQRPVSKGKIAHSAPETAQRDFATVARGVEQSHSQGAQRPVRIGRATADAAAFAYNRHAQQQPEQPKPLVDLVI